MNKNKRSCSPAKLPARPQRGWAGNFAGEQLRKNTSVKSLSARVFSLKEMFRMLK
jgi:hypothetical protein